MGRHSAAAATPVPTTPEIPSAIDVEPVIRLTRAQERALRDRTRRPLWRRTPVIPAIAMVVAIAGGGDAYHLVFHPNDAAARTTAADVKVDLNALATSDQLRQMDGGSRRVSRSERTVDGTPIPASLDNALPARPSLPKVQAGRTVLGNWVLPSVGAISTCFCMRWGVFHEGIDLAGPLGAPIYAVGDGVVLDAGPAAGFGHWIVIQHSNGDVSIYGHMYSVLVSKGDQITAGEHIADIGADGQATGPHLHFGVRQGGPNGPYIDPIPWLRARGITIGSYNPNE
ncbi:MAG TPA: M23 family metallopeptidase [Jatrophihabitans sp.]